MFEIQSKGDDGNWSVDYVGEQNVASFATEEDANDMIAELKKLGEEWEDGEYRVVPVKKEVI
mgnify:FL=1